MTVVAIIFYLTYYQYRFGTYSTSEAVNAGLDIEMPGPTRFRSRLLQHALDSNKVTRHTLDKRAKAVLNLVKRCAVSKIPENAKEKTNDTPETASFLRKVASDAIVLMKNERNFLPLQKDKLVGTSLRQDIAKGLNIAQYRPSLQVLMQRAPRSVAEVRPLSFHIMPSHHSKAFHPRLLEN
jgi:beta-glucosidase-like glycosyl hydrolase